MEFGLEVGELVTASTPGMVPLTASRDKSYHGQENLLPELIVNEKRVIILFYLTIIN